MVYNVLKRENQSKNGEDNEQVMDDKQKQSAVNPCISSQNIGEWEKVY